MKLGNASDGKDSKGHHIKFKNLQISELLLCTQNVKPYVVSWLTFGNVDAENFENSTRDQEANYCFLPPYPEHGRYTVKNYPNAIPGESYPRVALDLSWDKGYKDENIIKCIFCVNGYWSATMSTCSSYCTLNDDLSLEYRCVLSGSGSLKDSRQCESLVPAGTVVTPICRAPDFYSLKALSKMYCRDGIWDYKPICKPACGIISPQLNDTSNNQVDFPWHAGVYRKLSDPYLQICAGSLIKSNTVISAAHCFWNLRTHLSPPSDYVVTVGKLYRLYNDPRDKNSQQSDVVDIKIPSRFKGEGLNNQNDIALLFIKTPFIFHMSVRPVCLDFDYNLDRSQLTDGKMGKAAGWSITHNNIQASPVLNVADIPYINIIDCNNNSPIYFQPYITSDKFCAGSDNGTAFCREDIGGGIAFLESTTQRYYLRGVFSGGLIDEDACSSFNLYTSIVEHENFIKQYL